MNKKKENKTVINNWHFREIFGALPSIMWLCKFLIALILVTSFTSITASMVTENKDVYESCLDACEIPAMTGHTLKTMGQEFASIDPDMMMSVPDCVDYCSEMYLILRNK